MVFGDTVATKTDTVCPVGPHDLAGETKNAMRPVIKIIQVEKQTPMGLRGGCEVKISFRQKVQMPL